MVDVTDIAFRSVARAWGADVTCSEMVAAIGLNHDSATAWRHVQPAEGETPYGVQFMTGDPEDMRKAVLAVGAKLGGRIQFVDVNLGCPAPNIMKVCAGGFLMKDPDQAGRVIRAARMAADEVGIPHVSVKMRLGPTAARHTYVEVGHEAEAAGAAWATLHARTVEQGYSGQAEWHHIGRLVESVTIPVVGNGDLRTPSDVVRMRDETGCAGFFIARAAMHDPTVFGAMRAGLDGRSTSPPSPQARFDALLAYLDAAEAAGMRSVPLLRRQATRFIAGWAGAARLRGQLQDVRDVDALRSHAVAWREAAQAGAFAPRHDEGTLKQS